MTSPAPQRAERVRRPGVVFSQPCHADAIIAEGVARGIWTPGETT